MMVDAPAMHRRPGQVRVLLTSMALTRQGTQGRRIQLSVNAFPITKAPDFLVFHCA